MRFFPSVLLLAICLIPAVGQEAPRTINTPFDQLKVSGNIHLHLIPDTIQGLSFRVENHPENSLDQGVKDGVLQLKTKSEITQSEAIAVQLHYRALKGMELQKGARVQSADTLFAEELTLEVLNGAKTELTIRAGKLDARVNQGADIILYGMVGTQHIDAYTWGNFLGYDLEAGDTYIKAATGAQVKVRCNGVLEVNATSKAFVGYKGQPEGTKIKATVGGEVVNAD